MKQLAIIFSFSRRLSISTQGWILNLLGSVTFLVLPSKPCRSRNLRSMTLNDGNAIEGSITNYSNSVGTTSIVVIGAALTALTATIAAAAWEVGAPMVCMVVGVVSAVV